MSEHILVRKEQRTITLMIARIDKKNALTQDMYRTLADAINDYDKDDTSRALILTGQGEIFTAGNDLRDFSLGGDGDETPAVIRFLEALRDCSKPVIACVNGTAIGVGLTMLLHCDLVYASEQATFSAPFAQLGLVPEAGSSMLLSAAVGMAIANDVLLAGRTLSAEEALRHGLIAQIFGHAELVSTVEKIAANISGFPPNAMKLSKALIRNQRDLVSIHMTKEADLFARQLNSAEFGEAISAMREKRPPVFG